MDKAIIKATGCLSIAIMVGAIIMGSDISQVDKGLIAFVAVIAIAIIATRK